MKDQNRDIFIDNLKATNKNRRSSMKIIAKAGIFTVLFLLAAGILWAGDITGGKAKTVDTLFTYSPGATASSEEVNQNFAVVREAVNDNDARIDSLEAIGADITGVTAGSGLTGGGTSGNVTISVGTGTITSAHLATNSVYADEIAANAVGASEIAANAVGASEIVANAVTAAKLYPDVGKYNTGSVSAAITNSTTTLGQVSITPPRADGYFIVTVSGVIYNDSGPVNVQVSMGISDSPTGSYVYPGYIRAGHLSGTTGVKYFPAHITRVYSNTSTAQRTFYVRGIDTYYNSADPYSMYGIIIVQWFPGVAGS